MSGSAAERVLRALEGDAGLVAGMTYVPVAVLAGVSWGAGSSGIPLVDAARSAMDPDFVFISAEEPWAARAANLLADRGVPFMWSVCGPLGRAAGRLGWSESLRMSATRPAALAELFDDGLPEMAGDVRSGIGLGATAVVIADDLASGTGPLVSPDFALAEVVSRCAVVADAAIGCGIPAVFHSDGDVRPFLPALADAGFSAVHPGGLEGDALIAHLAAARRSGLATLGGLPASVLRSGAVAAERAVTVAVVELLRGGLLVADDGGISTTEELGALISALTAARGAIG